MEIQPEMHEFFFQNWPTCISGWISDFCGYINLFFITDRLSSHPVNGEFNIGMNFISSPELKAHKVSL